MNIFETKKTFHNPLTYLLPLILSLVWFGGLLLCPLTGDILRGVDTAEIDAGAKTSSILFLLVSAASIFGYLCFSFKFPNLLFRIIIGILWAPVTCVIYTLIIAELDSTEGIVSSLFVVNSISEFKPALGELLSWIVLVSIYFVIDCWYMLIALIPATIYCCDRLSHYFGLTAAYRKREQLVMQNQFQEQQYA